MAKRKKKVPSKQPSLTVSADDFSDWQHILSEALVDSIERALTFMQSIECCEDGSSPINGIAYEIAPWFGSINISLRDESDEVFRRHERSDSPGWKYTGILDEIGESNKTNAARRLIRKLYEGAESSNAARVAHLIFLAAARSLLDPRISDLLVSAGVNALVMPDYFEIRASRERAEIPHFDFIVEDPDGTVPGNYCDLVLLDLATRACLSE